MSLSPFLSQFWDLVAHRACVLTPLVFPVGKTHLSLLETGVEAHLPQFPLLEFDSHDTAVPLQPGR